MTDLGFFMLMMVSAIIAVLVFILIIMGVLIGATWIIVLIITASVSFSAAGQIDTNASV